jgi:hypothetical protein
MVEASWPNGISVAILRSNAMRDMSNKQDFNETINNLIAKNVCTMTMAKENGQPYQILVPTIPNDKLVKGSSVDRRKEIELNILRVRN